MTPKLYNRHHGNAPVDAVYIGRGSAFGNPYEVDKHGTRAQVIDMYYYRLCADKELQEKVMSELEGKDLVCYCAPCACHGDILLHLANQKKMPAPKERLSKFVEGICRILHADVVSIRSDQKPQP